MKIEIIKNNKNQPIGWTMEGENKEEINKLCHIRNLQFFGFKSDIPGVIDTTICYNGRSGGNIAEGNPGILSWKQNHYIKNK